MAVSYDSGCSYFASLKVKLDHLLKNKKCHVDSDFSSASNQVTHLLNDCIVQLHEGKKKDADYLADNGRVLVEISLWFGTLVEPSELLRVAKVCQIWEQVLQLPNITLAGTEIEQFINWFSCAFKCCDELILVDLLNCLASAVLLKEVKQAKVLERLIGSSGLVMQRAMQHSTDITDLHVLVLRISCNFTHCPGEKDWSSLSKDILKTSIEKFIQTLESCLRQDPGNLKVLKALVFCFQGLENIFVRFQTMATPFLQSIFGLAYYYILFGVPGQSLKYSPLLPSSVPFTDVTPRTEQGKTPTVRKKRPPTKSQSKHRNPEAEAHGDPDGPRYQPRTEQWVKPWTSLASSSDSELSDSEGQNAQRLKEAQAKVRSGALKMLSAAYKFCDQRTIMSYWSAFLPDSSPGRVFRHTLITPVLKDASIKVRCSALTALSSLLQAIQPTLRMASYQENRTGAFIPFSQTLGESVIAVQRSLLLSLSAEQSVGALIQLFKCLTVAASVFPYDKLPSELVPKTVHQCIPFLEHKDPDVKVACLSVLRVLLCSHSSHPEVLNLFWDASARKCWLIEHCLTLIGGSSGFPLTLESLLVIGEVTRSNLQLSQPYLTRIVYSVCRKLLTDQDSGVKIRCAKALSLVGSSILQEMDKDDHEQVVSRDEVVQLWTFILREGIAEILQSDASAPLKAETCGTLATIGSQIFECLPRELRILFVTLTLGCATENDPSVRAAAVRTLGFAVTFNTLNDDASFLLDSSEQVLSLLKDSNLLVALNASWALGNLADTLDKDKNSLLEELPRNFLIDLVGAAVHAVQGPMKVRCNVIRALGIFLKIISEVPAEGDEAAALLDRAISTVAKQVTTGNFMKNRWNACYACGNIIQNISLLTAFPHWMDKLLEGLLTVFRSCSNFKVRISAANALLHLNQRQLLSNHYVRIWASLLDSLAESEHIDDFNEFQHHETMCRQICNTLCKLVTLATKEDLGQLQEILVKYYDVFSSHFEKFRKSLLPDQLELLMEASTYIRQLGQPGGALSAGQKSTLDILQELFLVPD